MVNLQQQDLINFSEVKKLTIAIPTYNRSKRLEKCLLDLCKAIAESSCKQDIAVFVSNNGSQDTTDQIVMQCGEQYKKNGIPFFSRTAESNEGFDANVLACYKGCNSEYVWFLSDDDNISSGAIDVIVKDIDEYSPSVLYYNFDQMPFDNAHPYVISTEYFGEISDINIIALQKIVNWPKLTSLVIRKCFAGLKVTNQDSGYAHVALALQCGLAEGRVLHSSVFISYPDDDYMDHIEFLPHISNNIDRILRHVLLENGRMNLYNQLALPYVDPLPACLNTLGAYYRGAHVLTLPLKNELWETVLLEIRKMRFKRLLNLSLLKELIKFPISIFYFIFYSIFKGKSPARKPPKLAVSSNRVPRDRRSQEAERR